jgi:hypothetical protein
LKVVRDAYRLPKREHIVADDKLIEIGEADRLMNPPLVQKGSLLLPKSISQNSPTFCTLMIACRREIFCESR